MSNTIEEYGYSDQLFDNLFEKIKGDLVKFCNAKNFNFNFRGLWAFAYLEGANSLNSIYFNHENLADIENNYKSILQKIRQTSLECDYGSLGF